METRNHYDLAMMGEFITYEDTLMKVVSKNSKWMTLKNLSDQSLIYVRRECLPEELPEKEVLEEVSGDIREKNIGELFYYMGELVRLVDKGDEWVRLCNVKDEICFDITYRPQAVLLYEKEVSKERCQTKNIDESLANFNKAVEEHLEREAELKYREGVKKIFEFKWQCGDRVSYTSAVASKCSRAKRKVRRFIERCYNEKVTKISLASVSDLLK